MTTADLTTTTTLITSLQTAISGLSGLTGSDLIAQQIVVLSAGNAARIQCQKLCQLLTVQRQINARGAVAALINLSLLPALYQPIENFSFSVQAMVDQQELFESYSGHADKGLASYQLLPGRWTTLMGLLQAESGLVT